MGVVRGADDLTIVEIDWHASVGAGAFAGDKVAIGEADEQASLTVGGVGEVDRAVVGHVSVADDGAGM